MHKTTKRYCEIDASDVIRAAGRENYDLLISFLKQNLDYGTAQPQGGGDYKFELDFLDYPDFSEEEMKADYFEDDYCPIPVAKAILLIKAEQKAQGFEGLKLRYTMDGWT
jgi:hypothetical protein